MAACIAMWRIKVPKTVKSALVKGSVIYNLAMENMLIKLTCKQLSLLCIPSLIMCATLKLANYSSIANMNTFKSLVFENWAT